MRGTSHRAHCLSEGQCFTRWERSGTSEGAGGGVTRDVCPLVGSGPRVWEGSRAEGGPSGRLLCLRRSTWARAGRRLSSVNETTAEAGRVWRPSGPVPAGWRVGGRLGSRPAPSSVRSEPGPRPVCCVVSDTQCVRWSWGTHAGGGRHRCHVAVCRLRPAPPALGGRVDVPTALSIWLDLPLPMISQLAMSRWDIARSWVQTCWAGVASIPAPRCSPRTPHPPWKPFRCWARRVVSLWPEVGSAPLWGPFSL